MKAEICRQRAERHDDERDLQEARQHAVEAAQNDARQQRQSDRNPGIDVVKLDEQRRQARGDSKNATDRKVDFHHRHQIDHAEGDDPDQRGLAQYRLDRTEAEKFRVRNANRKHHQDEDDDQAGIFRPAEAQQRKLPRNGEPLGVACGI
jgi:hypothetical protein